MAWQATRRTLLQSFRNTAHECGSWDFWCRSSNSRHLRRFSTLRTSEIPMAGRGGWENFVAQGRLFDSGSRLFHSSAFDCKPTAARASGAGLITSDFEDMEDLLRKGTGWISSESLSLQTDKLQTLFAGFTTRELMFMLMNLQLAAFEPAVDLGSKILTSQLMKWSITADPVSWLLKKTAYSHFCAGENLEEARVTLARLWKLRLKSILVYGSEDATDEISCDKNYEGFLQAINMVKLVPENSVSSICVKISAICPVDLLKRVSDHLRWQHTHPGYKLSWKHDGLPIFAPESSTYHTQQIPEPLTPEEEANYCRAQQRLRKLCERASEVNVPLLLDAEYLSIQPAIDYLSYAAAEEFNSCERPIVYTTLQTYLSDAPSRLSLVLDEAARRRSFLALKIVRGAYIYKEKAEATMLGAECPINRDIETTHQCFDSCNFMVLDHVAARTCALICATHNMHSGRLVAQKVDELGLSRADPLLQFAQLKGMADSLSLVLAQAGFTVSKWLTFGEVEKTIPYLVRRAQENRGLLGNNLADRQRLWAELWCRSRISLGLGRSA